MVEKRKQFFLFSVFFGIVYTAMTYYGVVITANVKAHFPIYAALHEAWLCVFPLALIVLFVNRENLFYRAKYFRFAIIIMLFIVLGTILLFSISTVFIMEPSVALVNSLYFGHLALFIFYFTKYFRLWNGILSGEVGQRHALRIEQYGWTEDVIHPNGPKDNDQENNRPFYAKVLGKVGNYLVASVFILPTLFAMSATGTGGNIPLYFAQLFIFLIAPFAYYAIAKGLAWYLFIRRLEKEKNVIIYNGVWLV